MLGDWTSASVVLSQAVCGGILTVSSYDRVVSDLYCDVMKTSEKSKVQSYHLYYGRNTVSLCMCVAAYRVHKFTYPANISRRVDCCLQ